MNGRAWTAKEEIILKTLVLQGKSDREIGGILGRSQYAVQCHRMQMGLVRPRSDWIAHHPEGPAKGRSKSLAIKRAFAPSRGWPEGLPLQCIRAIELLCDEGPKTRDEIRKALRMKAEMKTGQGNLLAVLERYDLVHTIKGAISVGKSHRTLYFPTMDAVRRRQEFLNHDGRTRECLAGQVLETGLPGSEEVRQAADRAV